MLLAYEGKGPPDAAMLDKRTRLHARLLQDEVGAVRIGEASHGLAELLVAATDVDQAKQNIWLHVNALGIALRATVHVDRARCGRCHGRGDEPCRACRETGTVGEHGGTGGVCGGTGAVEVCCVECRGDKTVAVR